MPAVDGLLQRLAPFKQRTVLRPPQVSHDRGKARPEGPPRLHPPGARQRPPPLDELRQFCGHLQPAALNPIDHYDLRHFNPVSL